MSLSLYYIRFLKPPPLKCELYQPFNIVWTIESDLGYHCLDQSILLTCQTNKSDLIDIKYLPIIKPTKKRKKGNSNSNSNSNNNDSEEQQITVPTNLEYDPQRGLSGMVTRIMLVPTSNNKNITTNNKDQHKRKLKNTKSSTSLLNTTMNKNIQLQFSLSTNHRRKEKNGSYIKHPVWYQAYQLDTTTNIYDYDHDHDHNKKIWIIPIWSMPIDLDLKLTSSNKQGINNNTCIKDPISGQQAQRVIEIDDDKDDQQQLIYICEDIEESIARHVWDCGLIMCDFIYRNKKSLNYQSIIELGSGTGVVGIYAAAALKPKRMDLTDLSDALNILQQNININFNNKDNAGLTIEAKVLSWGPPSHTNINNQDDNNDDNDDQNNIWQHDNKKIDLILLTDVLYNHSSHDILLETLTWLIEKNPKTKILLGYKERNPDERSFFTKVNQHPFLHCIKYENQPLSPFEVYWILKK
ncbi:unnamed protein product [Cunninghamella blakesleeana]